MTDALLAVIAAQLGVLVIQQGRLVSVLRVHVVASTRAQVYLAKLAALFRLSPPTELELELAQAPAPAPPAQAAAKR